MNILAVEPFYSGSHKAFLKGLKEHSKHNIIPVNLSYKGRKWRMHGNSVVLAGMTKEVEESLWYFFLNYQFKVHVHSISA